MLFKFEHFLLLIPESVGEFFQVGLGFLVFFGKSLLGRLVLTHFFFELDDGVFVFVQGLHRHATTSHSRFSEVVGEIFVLVVGLEKLFLKFVYNL